MSPASVELVWLPLGAGGHCVRLCGLVYEAGSSRRTRRPARALYHSALRIRVASDVWVVEMTPVWSGGKDVDRGVVAVGAVGSTIAGRLRLFRYEVHCWRGGAIDDIDAAEALLVLSTDPVVCGHLLDLMPQVPAPVWGRDDRRAGEMWNSNSVTSWALSRAGVAVDAVGPPRGGGAPGWRAGIVVAQRELLAQRRWSAG